MPRTNVGIKTASLVVMKNIISRGQNRHRLFTEYICIHKNKHYSLVFESAMNQVKMQDLLDKRREEKEKRALNKRGKKRIVLSAAVLIILLPMDINEFPPHKKINKSSEA